MSKRRRVQLGVEMLENRLVPATVRFFSGNLSISPGAGEPALNLTVLQTAANTFNVNDRGANLGTYAGVSNINITGGNGADTVTVNLATFTYTGSLNSNTGNGNDTFTLRSAGGAILGMVNLRTGLGNDSVSINGAPSTGAITVGGPIFVTGSAGNDSITLGNATGVSRFLGNVILNGMNQIGLAEGQADVFGGDLDAFLGNKGGRFDFETPPTATAATINGNLLIVGGQGNNTVVDSNLIVNRDVNINFGGFGPLGNFVSENAPGFPLLQVGGNYTYNGSGNFDQLILAGNSVAGNMTLNLGNGNDTIDLSTVGGLVPSPTIGGNLSISGGNGNINFNGLTGEGITAQVNGNMTFNLGNGNDTATIVNAPAGTLGWTSGNGADSLTFAPTTAGQIWNVNIQFGNNDDTFTLAGTGANQTITGRADGGGRIAGNVYTPGANWNPVNFTLSNFP